MQGNFMNTQKKYSICSELLGFYTLSIVRNSICCLPYTDGLGHMLCSEVKQVSLLLGCVSNKLLLNDYIILFMYWIILHAHWEISPQHYYFSSPSLLACIQTPRFFNWSVCMIMVTCTWPSCGMQQWYIPCKVDWHLLDLHVICSNGKVPCKAVWHLLFHSHKGQQRRAYYLQCTWGASNQCFHSLYFPTLSLDYLLSAYFILIHLTRESVYSYSFIHIRL
jgi:hypothetical protein